MAILQAFIKCASKPDSLKVLQLWVYLVHSALDQAVHQRTGCYFKSSPTWKRRLIFILKTTQCHIVGIRRFKCLI